MDDNGLRGSAAARIDEKGRLKIPTSFRGAFQNGTGANVFVTSLTGDSVRIYPMSVWLDLERKLAEKATTHPAVVKFIDRVNYFGQSGDIDGQGRIVISPDLRGNAAIIGDCRVIGRITYIEVWNEERIAQKLKHEPWTDEDGLKLAELGI